VVLLILGAVIIGGGGRRLWQARRARRVVGRLDGGGATPAEVLAAADHGRAGLTALFRILGTADDPARRDAAGAALARLWAADEMIPEEEKALVRRGYRVDWRARRRYPRGLRAEVPVAADYGVPFLRDGGPGVGPAHLEWSHRVVGARRASLEVFTPFKPGPGRASFSLVPADFAADGPHKLVLETKVRPVGLTSAWELDLPHVPFSFEFDPRLAVDALLASPDDARASAFDRAVTLRPAPDPDPTGRPDFLPLNGSMALRATPAVEVAGPIPADLAHAVALEFEGVPGWHPAGGLVVLGQGPAVVRSVPLALRSPLAADAVDHPGPRRIRARLVADPDRGWADPDARSVWPGTVTTDWVDAEVVRL